MTEDTVMYVCENCYTDYSEEVVCCDQKVLNLTPDYMELDFNEHLTAEDNTEDLAQEASTEEGI